MQRVFYLSSRYGPRRDPHSFPTRRSSDLNTDGLAGSPLTVNPPPTSASRPRPRTNTACGASTLRLRRTAVGPDRKSTRLNSSHVESSYAVFCLKKKNLRLSPPTTQL